MYLFCMCRKLAIFVMYTLHIAINAVFLEVIFVLDISML